jgi:hypothetical protein
MTYSTRSPLSDHGNEEPVSTAGGSGNTDPEPQPGDPGEDSLLIKKTFLTVLRLWKVVQL